MHIWHVCMQQETDCFAVSAGDHDLNVSLHTCYSWQRTPDIHKITNAVEFWSSDPHAVICTLNYPELRPKFFKTSNA